MRAFKRYSRAGFTLVELMIVVAIIGILAALAIYGVRRYLASAKTSEAKNNIGAINRGAQGAYERESNATELLAEGSLGTEVNHNICAGATAVPAAGVPDGKKYQPVTTSGADFNAGDNLTGWKCLKFSMTTPHYFRYGYLAFPIGGASGGTAPATMVGGAFVGVAPAAGQYLVWAQGDLDADSEVSGFAQSAAVNTTTKALRVATELQIVNEYE